MAKSTPDAVLDLPLDDIATSTRISMCSAEPANFAGIAAVSLGDVTVTGGDFTKADGDVSGRKVTVSAQNGVPVSTNGTMNHLVLDNGSVIKHITTTDALAITTSDTVNLPAFDIEFEDPA